MDTKGKFFDPLAFEVAGGASIRAASVACNCSATHAYHISATTEFKNRVSELRSEVAQAIVGTLTSAAAQAASTLLSLLDESNEPSIRLASAKAILAAVGPLSELGELRSRLDRLEQKS